MTDHSLGGGNGSSKLDAAEADLAQFPTSNIYDGGCASCACEIPIVLQYEDGAPVPDAEFVVKWGEQEEGEEGEIIVTPTTPAQRAAPEIKGVVDTNGLARVTNSPCGSYVILFGEGSDAMQPRSLERTSELYLAIEAATASAGVGTLTPTGRGQLLWWMSAWMKEKAAKHMTHRIRNGELSSKAEVIDFFQEYGAPLWTDEGQVDQEAKDDLFEELNNESIDEIAETNFFAQDGALNRLEEALEDKLDDLGKPDDPGARRVAETLERTLVNGDNIPNERFYQVLQNVKQAEEVAAQLVDPNEPSSWDVFLLVAEAVLGFIPVVGDVIDVVDIIKWLYKFSDDSKSPETWDYVELGALSLGFIPAIGFVLKKTFAPIARFFAGVRGASKVAGSVSGFLQRTIQVLRRLGDGNLIQWLVKKKDEVKEVLSALKDVMRGLCESVIGALRKYIQNAWFWNPAKALAERLLAVFSDFKNSLNKYLDPFFNKVDDMIASFIAKIANRFVGSAGKNIDPTVFKLRRRNADGSGGLGGRGNGEKPPDGTCPIGMQRAMGSNPVNMILGQPFQHHTDFSAGLFALERCWTPGQGGGLFGPLWSTPLSSYVRIDAKGASFQTAMGRKIPFDVPVAGAVCVNVHEDDYQLIEYGKGYAIKDAKNLLWIYEQHDGSVRRLSAVRDANGNGFELSYALDLDATIGLQPRRLTLSNGETYELTVQAGRLRRITHSATGSTEAFFDYNDKGLLAGATNAAGFRMGYYYDKQRRLTGLDYNKEHHTRYSYDDKNRVIAVTTDTQYFHDRFEYGEPNAHGIRAVSCIDTLGNRMTTHIDQDDKVLAVVEPNGATTRYRYNDKGDVIEETNALGATTKQDWDTLGNPLNILHPDGSEERFERDERGRLLSYTDAAGAQWSYERDAAGNIIAEHWPDGQSWQYQLNPQGQPTKIQHPNGAFTHLAYNKQQRLSHYKDALGAITSFAYNARGRLASRTEADGTSTQYHYDAAGRLRSASLANGTQLHWRWSARGDLLQAADGEGKITQREFGPYGLLKSVTNPMGGTIHFEHDRLMRLSGVINEKNEKYHYRYDANHRVTDEMDFSGRQLHYAYDIAGRLVAKIAGNGIKTAYSYTAMNRLSQTKVFDKGEHEAPSLTSYAYDACGRLRAAKNPDATVTFERDALGRIICETLNGRKIESTYNAHGELASRDVDGRPTHYHYDANGRISALGIGEHAPLEFSRDLLGRERQRRSGKGFAEFRAWDPLGQLSAQIAGRENNLLTPNQHDPSSWEMPRSTTGGVAAAREYEYDKAFNPIAIVDAHWGSTQYHYNANDQVTRVHNDSKRAGLKEERFTYDAARNIEQAEQIELGASLSLLQEPAEHTTRHTFKRAPGGRIERRGDTTYAYDSQGRMISKRMERKGFRPQSWTYQWDGEDRLRRLTTPDKAIWEYHYDPFGRRIGKQRVHSGGQHHRHADKVSYLWSGNLLSEEKRIYADGSEKTVAYHYEQESFRPIAQEVDGELNYIVTDHLGTPKELLSEEGERLWSARHELWGKVTQTRKAANDDAPTCLLRFQGQIEDEESGFYYNRFRYYDPESGNYACADPIGLEGGLKQYGYVDAPVLWIDPFGLSGCESNKVGRHGDLRNDPSPGQSHHLNQDAAYRDVIPTNDGSAIKLEGNAFTQPGTPHYEAHKSLEGFWDQYRRGGELQGQMPTNLEYTQALKTSLEDAGLSADKVNEAVQASIRNRVEYGALGGQNVPRLPGRINQAK